MISAFPLIEILGEGAPGRSPPGDDWHRADNKRDKTRLKAAHPRKDQYQIRYESVLANQHLTLEKCPNIRGSALWNCLDKNALTIMNELRTIEKLAPFTLGPQAMQKNAHAHSMDMYLRDALFHQNIYALQELHEQQAGCVNVTGESVLRTSLPRGTDLSRAATLCVAELVRSPANFAIVISTFHAMASAGIHIDDRGFVWCTHLFAVKRVGSGCLSIEDEAPAVSFNRPSMESAPAAAKAHVFRHQIIITAFENDIAVSMVLTCNMENRPCIYCTSDGSRCLTAEQSVEMDQKLAGEEDLD